MLERACHALCYESVGAQEAARFKYFLFCTSFWRVRGSAEQGCLECVLVKARNAARVRDFSFCASMVIVMERAC